MGFRHRPRIPRRPSNKAGERKTFVDNVLAFSPVLISAVISIVGVIISQTQVASALQKDRFEREKQRYDIIKDVANGCMSNNEEDKRRVMSFTAFLVEAEKQAKENQEAERIKQDQAKRKFVGLAPPWSKGASKVDDSFDVDLGIGRAREICARWMASQDTGQSVSDAKSPENVKLVEAASKETIEKWVYIGTYTNGVWATHYLDFGQVWNPTPYVKENPNRPQPPVFRVRPETGALNLRGGKFSPTGAFPDVIGSLAPRTDVKLLETWRWFGSDNWWARVSLDDKAA